MKNIWNLIVHGYIPVRGMKPDTKTGVVPIGKISIKLLVLIIGAIIVYTYLIQEDKNMVDWIKNEAEELKDWVISGTVVEVKAWWVIAVWVIWKYALG